MRKPCIGVSLRTLLAPLILFSAIAPSQILGGWPFEQPSNTEKLADCIDKLERHIDQYGSVVPKQPDVWGQARLTKYRTMVDKALLNEGGKFRETLSGAISRSDQASFANSLAIQAAISGPQAFITRRGGTTIVNSTPPQTSSQFSNSQQSNTSGGNISVLTKPATVTLSGFKSAFTGSTKSSSTTSPATTDSSDNTDPTPIETPDAPKDITSALQSVTFAPNTLQVKFNGGDGATGIGLEPTVYLDQLTNYLNHLNQLRRTNEGDDTSDAPGYALHLVRIPVSVLPGKKTQQGYGAEITITAEPMVTDTLLPTVFRSLVTNDVIDLASAAMMDPLPAIEEAKQALSVLSSGNSDDYAHRNAKMTLNKLRPRLQGLALDNVIFHSSANPSNYAAATTTLNELPASTRNDRSSFMFSQPAQAPRTNSATPFPSDVFSNDMRFAIDAAAKDGTFQPEFGQRSKRYLILDLRKIAARYADAAYGLLTAEGNDDLWTFASQQLLLAVQNNDHACVDAIRCEFVSALSTKSSGYLNERCHPIVAMAWAIIYDATLLNHQLLRDIEKVESDHGNTCSLSGQWIEFFRPQPAPEARGIFAQYVRHRWPIHVFAIDPMTDDQNVADTFSRRREMQLALSLAFSSGQIGVQNFTRYARQLDLDMESIALNRTQVGFSHGNDTFGWRFYPRFQSPPTDGNVKVLFRDLLIGGPSRKAELNSMKLEPGARECVALVIMPSFVPSVRFDTRTNWFRLSNPKHKEFDLKETVRLGTDIECLRQYSTCCQSDSTCRTADLALMMRTVDQLERRLPLQTCVSQVPFELTESGNTLFNHGVTDLAPRLRGYYGEPGAKDKDMSITIIGENFSVTDTQVIAGNIQLGQDQVTMLSRQVVIIKIPAGANVDSGSYDVHVATPYGVSNHLDVHLPTEEKAPPEWKMKPQAVIVYYTGKLDRRGNIVYKSRFHSPAIVLTPPSPLTISETEVLVTLQLDGEPGPTELTVAAVSMSNGKKFRLDVNDLGDKLTEALVTNGASIIPLDPQSPPTVTLTAIQVAVGTDDPVPLDGTFSVTLKPYPGAKDKENK